LVRDNLAQNRFTKQFILEQLYNIKLLNSIYFYILTVHVDIHVQIRVVWLKGAVCVTGQVT